MKKMPCVFVREFVNNRVANITDQVTPGCEWMLAGEGVPYVKRDGTACAVINGALYRRYDAKRGKTPPSNAIPCDDAADPVTGHWPHWLPVGNESQDKWFMAAWLAAWDTPPDMCPFPDGTYELCGPHFQTNPHALMRDTFFSHTEEPVSAPWAAGDISFENLRKLMSVWYFEGIVFHHPDGRKAKIRRADFGFEWPLREEA